MSAIKKVLSGFLCQTAALLLAASAATSIGFAQTKSNSPFACVMNGLSAKLADSEAQNIVRSPETANVSNKALNLQKAIEDADREALALLRSNDIFYRPYLKNHLIANQSGVEANLQLQLDHYIQANAPPEPFAKMAKTWGAFIGHLPSKLKRDFTTKLLKAQATSVNNATRLISQLEPEPGVRDAVALFLKDSPLTQSNRTDFSQSQVLEMFGGERFRKFFPWIHETSLDGGIRTKFSLALLTNPALPGNERSVSSEWLRSKLNDNEVQVDATETIGFRPAMSYPRLNRQLEDGFYRPALYGSVTPTQQLRGLIVQGSYEKQGNTIMEVLSRERGQAQVEGDAARLMRTMNAQLQNGRLRSQSELDKRLFVYNWSMDANANTIGNMRQRAIWIANNTRQFYGLRVEIHNFPTWDTVRRTENFLADYNGSAQVKEQLQLIINEMKQLLGGSSTPGQMEELVRALPASNANRDTLTSLVENYSALSPTKRLERIQELRSKWKEIKLASNSTSKTVDLFSGDRKLSEQAMVESSNLLQQFERHELPTDPAHILDAARSMIQQVQLDDLLTQEQSRHLIKALESIQSEKGFTQPKKLETMSSLITNAVDQVYYRLKNDYSAIDERFAPLVNKPDGKAPVRFIDGVLRSQNSFPLSKLSEQIDRTLLAEKKLEHDIAGKSTRSPIEVFNPGEKTGRLRFNSDPHSLTPDDIAVFDQMPSETAPVGGIITLGVGARLSHLQLLAKSLRIPNAKFSKDYVASLKALDGKLVRYSVNPSGKVQLQEARAEGLAQGERALANVQVPVPDHSIKTPISFEQLGQKSYGNIAGPKGLNLAKMRTQPVLRDTVPDGFVIPFGFFDQYAELTGLKPWLDLLGKIDLKNQHLVATITDRITRHIQEHPIPEDMLDQVMNELSHLKQRTRHEGGYFFRSDTNIEDLPGFNGAGLNESVPNVKNERAQVQHAIQSVWISPFRENSIYWRGMALKSPKVSIAEPSVVVMPTVSAESSGVILSRGGDHWQLGHGSISANWGIGSVVQAGDPVEELTLASGTPLRTSLTVANQKPVPNAHGGLSMTSVEPGHPVLTQDQIKALNAYAGKVEKALGPEDHGWDIEWAIDPAGAVKILQARPNM